MPFYSGRSFGRPGTPGSPTINLPASFTVGNTIAITGSLTGGRATYFDQYLDGIPTGRTVSASAGSGSYTIIAADCYPQMTFKARGQGGGSAHSNALQYSLPTTNLKGHYDGTNVLLTSGRVSASLDQSGLNNHLVQVTAGNRPTQAISGGLNNRDALDFSLNAGAGVLLINSNLGLSSGSVTIYTVAQVPANLRYISDGITVNSRVIFNNGGTSLALYAGSAVAGVSTIPGDWIIDSCIFNGASSKHSIDGGTDATGNPGIATSPGHTLGGGATNGAPQALNTKFAKQLIYSASHTDAQRAEIISYLQLWAMNTTGSARFYVRGDSVVKGYNGTAYNGGWRGVVTSSLPDLKHVGPHYSFGSHNGISGDTALAASTALSALDTDLQFYLPSKIGIALGANDIMAGKTTAQIQSYITAIVNQCKISRPTAQIYVQNIIQPIGGLSTNDSEATTYNAAFAAFISSLTGVVPVVITPGTVTSTDAVHPNDSSYVSVVAPLWISALT